MDESGSHVYKSRKTDVEGRYLCLLGVIIAEEERKKYFNPAWRDLRSLLSDDVDFPTPLHFIDVFNKRGVFNKLAHPATRNIFNEKYMNIISSRNFKICCVVLDKKSHFDKYQQSAQHPYHHCFNFLLQQYLAFLDAVDGVGDIVIESRGKKENTTLCSAYENLYTEKYIATRVTSKKLKISKKEELISGLELADMLVTIMKFFVLEQYELHTMHDNFSKKVIEELEENRKIISSPQDQRVLKEYGLKLVR